MNEETVYFLKHDTLFYSIKFDDGVQKDKPLMVPAGRKVEYVDSSAVAGMFLVQTTYGETPYYRYVQSDEVESESELMARCGRSILSAE